LYLYEDGKKGRGRGREGIHGQSNLRKLGKNFLEVLEQGALDGGKGSDFNRALTGVEGDEFSGSRVIDEG
jgi:hypothetical protein